MRVERGGGEEEGRVGVTFPAHPPPCMAPSPTPPFLFDVQHLSPLGEKPFARRFPAGLLKLFTLCCVLSASDCVLLGAAH